MRKRCSFRGDISQLPLIESTVSPENSGKLGVMLFQFPPWFIYKPENRGNDAVKDAVFY